MLPDHASPQIGDDAIAQRPVADIGMHSVGHQGVTGSGIEMANALWTVDR
jgi:hypothetical protein